MQNKLIVPEKHLVGIKYPDRKPNVDDDEGDEIAVPQAFMIPWAETPDKNMEKRKETVTSWLSGYKSSKIEIFDNLPQVGFTLGEVNRRYQTNNALWNVTDPRGFDIELSIENLSWLMNKITIVKGVIQDEMVWGKWKSQSYNLLIPVSDPDYQLAVKNTQDLKVKKVYVKESQLQVGQEVILQNGEQQAVYLGKARVNVECTVSDRSYVYFGKQPAPRVSTHVSDNEFYVFREDTTYSRTWYNLYKSLPKILSAGAMSKKTDLPTQANSDKFYISQRGNGYLVQKEAEANAGRNYYESIKSFV